MVERSRGVGSEGQRRRSTSRGASGAGELPGRAITAAHTFGQGFLSSPGNDALRGKLERGELYPAGLLEQLRVLLYRLLFCAAAEARGLLPVPAATEQVRAAYHGQPSFGRLIELSLGAGEPLRPSE
ncbi:MAG: hypothetical protein FJ125_02380, partial [Deltaproteobacteria bacterium]|nr:hypothetical protein [Deltaproteobacteria bacterium]